MADSEEAWIDEALLEDDRSTRGWKRQAVGMSANDATLRVPRTGQLTCHIPIGQWRIVRAHSRLQGVSLSVFLRQAVAAKLIAEGVDPATIPDLIRGTRVPRR